MDQIQRKNGASTREHWAALNSKWEKRTMMAAEWLRGRRSVVDIGCGLMALETLLPKTVNYIPMDVAPRDHRTIIIDLNNEPIPMVECDAATLLGVLEYTEDPGDILRQLRGFPVSVLSYNHISLNDLLWKVGLRPKRVTWRNRLTRHAFRKLIRSSGLVILRERAVRTGERLYEIRASS
jgi:hypothetical protein